MNPILECVPNFSEGRNPRVLDQLVAAASENAQVKLINVNADADHNRSVLTLLGAPEPLTETMFHLVQTAAELIDLDHHQGCHPRIGATDVVPFVPVRDASMRDAVDAAYALGEWVAAELFLPVFYYASAAKTPAHRKLSDIRRGGYETLRWTIGQTPVTTPDAGPAQLTPAGACVIGARGFLIAFNIFLDTADLTVAKQIARQIRESSGGLHGVQALGMLVGGMAQVSMNLTDFRVTSLRTVFQTVSALAAQAGTVVSHSELIGCLPRAAIDGIDPADIGLTDFTPDRILENHLD